MKKSLLLLLLTITLNLFAIEDLTSIVFNEDSIRYYENPKCTNCVTPLRSPIYPNNTGYTDEELFKMYKTFSKQSLKKIGNSKRRLSSKFLLRVMPSKKKLNTLCFDPCTIVAEYTGIKQKVTKEIAWGEYYYEYEIIEIYKDKHNFYKIRDKIKVYDDDEPIGCGNDRRGINEKLDEKLVLTFDDKFNYAYNFFMSIKGLHGSFDRYKKKEEYYLDPYSTFSFTSYDLFFISEDKSLTREEYIKSIKDYDEKDKLFYENILKGDNNE